MEWVAGAGALAAVAAGGHLLAYAFLPPIVQVFALVLLGAAGVAVAVAVFHNATRNASVIWRLAPFPLVVTCYILFFSALYATIEDAYPGTLFSTSPSWLDPWSMGVDSTVGSGMGMVLPASTGGKVCVLIAQYGTYLMTASLIPIALTPSSRFTWQTR